VREASRRTPAAPASPRGVLRRNGVEALSAFVGRRGLGGSLDAGYLANHSSLLCGNKYDPMLSSYRIEAAG
jgi:hypothetical protein